MIKKIDAIILVVGLLYLLIMVIIKSFEISYDFNIFRDYLKNLESNLKEEYKHSLKDNIAITLNFIESLDNRILNNHKKLIDFEIKKIVSELKNSNGNAINDYILKYNHSLFSLKREKAIGTIEKSFLLNKEVLYLSIDKNRIKENLIKAIKDFVNLQASMDERYIWVNEMLNASNQDIQIVKLVYPVLEADTKDNLFKGLDKKDKSFLQNKLNKNGDVFYEYFSSKGKQNSFNKKLVYSKFYKKRKWIVSSEISLYAINKIIEKKSIEREKKYKRHFNNILLVEFTVFIVMIFLFLLFRDVLIRYLKQNQLLKKQLESNLENAESMANKFFELSNNLHIIADFSGRIIRVNAVCKKILGYSKEELVGKNLLMFMHPDDLYKTKKEIEKLKNGKTVSSFENRYKHKNGHFVYLLWSANSDIEKDLVYASSHDISNIKIIELEKNKQEKMIFQQSKLIETGTLVRNVTHQWKQPLSNLNGILLNMQIDYNKNCLDDKTFDKYISRAEDITFYLSKTVNDFTNFFRREKEKERFLVDELLNKVYAMTNYILKEKRIDFIIKSEKNLMIESYPSELMQVVFSILNNAKDAFENSIIRNKYIKIYLYQKENYIYVEFFDNAGGIDKNILENIFEPYTTTKIKGKGTGLGLYISKLIIEKSLDGELYAENAMSGALFTIKLKKSDSL